MGRRVGMVRLDGVGLDYGSGPSAASVLHDISFSVPEGGFRWLLGPSGAGKKQPAAPAQPGRAAPSHGHLTLLGQDIGSARRGDLPLLRRRIGMVFQDFRLLPHLSAFDNVALPLRLAGRPEGKSGVDVVELMSWVGLSRKLQSRPAELSRAASSSASPSPGRGGAAAAIARGRAHRQPGRGTGRTADAVAAGNETGWAPRC